MPEEFKAGCARPTGGPVGEPETKAEVEPIDRAKKEVKFMVTTEERPRILWRLHILKGNLSM